MRAAPLALAVLAVGVGSACRRDAATSGTGVGDGGARTGADGSRTGDVRLPSADANCGMTGIGGAAPLTPEILVVLDRSIATDPTAWAAFLSQVGQTFTANDDK